MSGDDPFVLDDIVSRLSYDGYTKEDVNNLMSLLDTLDAMGSSWNEILFICLLGAAISANRAGMTPDEFMVALRQIKVTDEGIYGEA